MPNDYKDSQVLSLDIEIEHISIEFSIAVLHVENYFPGEFLNFTNIKVFYFSILLITIYV